MLRLTIALFGTVLILLAHPAYAYVWKCHTPNGDIWTNQPAPSDDCEEYDDVYNPGAAPPATQSPSPQIAPQSVAPPPQTVPAPPAYVGTYLPAPYYYNPGYYGPGVYLAPPAFGYLYGGYYGRRYGGFYGWPHGGHHRR